MYNIIKVSIKCVKFFFQRNLNPYRIILMVALILLKYAGKRDTVFPSARRPKVYRRFTDDLGVSG